MQETLWNHLQQLKISNVAGRQSTLKAFTAKSKPGRLGSANSADHSHDPSHLLMLILPEAHVIQLNWLSDWLSLPMEWSDAQPPDSIGFTEATRVFDRKY